MKKMTDIVERLKGYDVDDLVGLKDMQEAADEIERLRAVMETVADALHDKGDYECWAALRNALWQEGKKK
jgi:hypothetical protein